MEPKIQNKDQVIYNLRQQVRELESKVAILEKNVKKDFFGFITQPNIF